MHTHLKAIGVFIAALTIAHPLAGRAQDAAARAASVLANARAALGGEEKLRGVKTLQATGDFRRSMGEMQMEGELEILVEAPDKLRRNEEISLPHGPTMVRAEVLNGDEVWDDSSQRGGHGGMQIVLRGPDADPERLKELQRRMRRMDLARYMLVWLLATDAPVTHAGIAEAPDGRADVLQIAPDDGPVMRLFIDQQTHLPLMLSWRGPQPRVNVRRAGPGGPRPNPGQAEREAGEPAAPPPQATFEMRFAEYREVAGIRLPHEITRSINGEPNEEWTVASYKVNPPLKANTFTK